MTIIWVDWVNGLDTNAGTDPLLPKKTITSATTGRTGGDEIRVAKSPDPTPLSGTVGFTINSTAITGVNTLFKTELVIGDFILAPNGHYYEVITLTSDTAAILYKAYPNETQSGFSSSKLGLTSTGASSGSTTVIQEVKSTGATSNPLRISGGWDLSTQTKTGNTIFVQYHATFNNRYGYGLRLLNMSYVEITDIGFLRYSYGFYVNSSNYCTIKRAIASSNLTGFNLSAANFNNFEDIIANANNSTSINLSNCYSCVFTNVTCFSNATYAINLSNSHNNKFINVSVLYATANSLIYLSSSSNNYFDTIVSKKCTNGCFHLYNSHKNVVFGLVATYGFYGVYFQNSSENRFYELETNNNTYSFYLDNSGSNFVAKAVLAESTKFTVNTSVGLQFANPVVNVDNLAGYSYCVSYGVTLTSQNASAGGTGREWKLAITDTARSVDYPFYFSIAKIAVGSSGKVTVKVFFKKSQLAITGALRCRAGQVPWSDGSNDIVVQCPNNTNRNEVTLEFTPTASGVVEIEAGAWSLSTTQYLIIDDITVSQA